MTRPPDPGYGFVPLAPDVRRVAREQAQWHRRIPGTLAGCLDVELTAEQPIHVGSGGKDLRARAVVSRAVRIRGGPGIPGASFKGVLRARYEAITRSCAGPAPAAKQDIRSSTGIETARILPGVLHHPAFDGSPGCTKHHACPACALFGRMSLRSRITITDLACTGNFEIALIPERFGPNLHHIGPAKLDPSGTVFEVHGLHGRKFGRGRGPATESRLKVEAIPSGSHLTGQIRLFNVIPAELGGLLAVLGCDPPGALKLGGGKAHGFGRTRCKVRCRLVGHGAPPLDPAVWRQQFIDSPDRWPEGERRLFDLHRGDC